MQGSRRGGVTWIVVVVVVVVLVLVGALASMQLLAAREANRRDLCINNLRNIALALIGHESTHGAYPGYANVIKDKRASWLVSTLPYLERDDIYQLWQQTPPVALPLPKGSTGEKLATEGNPPNPWNWLYISLFVCPSAERNTTGDELSYVANCGSARTANDFLPPIDEARTWIEDVASGMFFNRARADYSDAVRQPAANPPADAFDPARGPRVASNSIFAHDGTAYTLLLSENLQAGHWATDPTVPAGEPPAPFQSEFQIKQQTGFVWFVTGKKNNALPPAEGAVFNSAGAPINGLANKVKRPLATEAFAIPKTNPAVGGLTFSRPSSNHPGGVVAFFCDGHVTFLADDTPYHVYTQFMTPNGLAAIVEVDGDKRTTAADAGWDYELKDADYQ